MHGAALAAGFWFNYAPHESSGKMAALNRLGAPVGAHLGVSMNWGSYFGVLLKGILLFRVPCLLKFPTQEDEPFNWDLGSVLL